MPRPTIHELGTRLLASLVLADPTRKTIPALPGVLSKALSSASQDGLFPDAFRESLTFVDRTLDGRVCLQAEAMLDELQLSGLLEQSIRPALEDDRIVCSERVAKAILARLPFDEESAKRWGRAFWGHLDAMNVAERRALQECGQL